MGFRAILDGLIESGLVKRRTSQRMDSTHVLGLVSRMSRVECVGESLRLALQEIESAVPAEQCPAAWATWWERYVENQLDYRSSHDVLVNKLLEVAESVEEHPLQPGEPTPGWVVGVVTQPAHQSDEAGAREMAVEQASMGMETPPSLYVDGAYVSAQRLAEAKAAGVELIGPAQSALKRRPDSCSAEDFDVQVEQRKATCPAGVENTQCSRLDGEKGRGVQYRFEWNQGLCPECPVKDRCLGPGQRHRSLVVREHRTELQGRRREQKEAGFRERMKKRNAIEGTHSELVRAHGMRRTRFRGLGRVRPGNYFTAAACNIKRWIRRVAWEAAHAARAVGIASAVATG